jgi:hypothetical protein
MLVVVRRLGSALAVASASIRKSVADQHPPSVINRSSHIATSLSRSIQSVAIRIRTFRETWSLALRANGVRQYQGANFNL